MPLALGSLFGIVALVTQSAVAAPGPADSAVVDYLWVLRGSLATRASVDSVVARASRMRVRGLLVQVVGRGDACYRSELLPRAAFLDPREGADFDPLGDLIDRAHAGGLEVHAWMNCMLVWSAPGRPADPRHVVNAHPEWIARLRDGRAMTALGMAERERAKIEGVFLSPAHPGVQAWVASVAKEIVERYPVDGIHLDYIRDPGVDVGWDGTTRARFALEQGVDPAHTEHLEAGERTELMAAWKRFQCEQVTDVVRGVRDSIRTVRAGVVLSAAVIADTVRAERWNSQPWRAWVRDGLVDRAFLMCYAVPVQTVMAQLARFAADLGGLDRIVPGIAMYNSTAVTAALKIKGARELGYSRVALYSYDSLFEGRTYWSALQSRLTPAVQGTR